MDEPLLVHGRDVGIWQVTTASGARLVLALHDDPLDDTVTRIADVPNSDPDADYDLAPLRRDGEAMSLLNFEAIQIGKPTVLTLGEVEDYPGYRATLRLTTPVVACDRVEA